MNPTVAALAHAMLSTCTDEFATPLDEFHSPCDVDSESLERIYLEYQSFVESVEKQISEKIQGEWETIDDFYNLVPCTENQTEYDYVLTRNYHGAGFWDGDWCEEVESILTKAARSKPEITAYIGDDGKIYFH